MKTKAYFSSLWFWVLLLVVQVGMVRFLSQQTEFVRFARNLSLQVSHAIGWLTAQIPFSVGDVLYFAFGVYILWILVQLVQYGWQRKLAKSKPAVVRFLGLVNLIYFLFHLNWGFHYYPSKEIIGYQKVDAQSIRPEELKQYAEKYLIQTKVLRPEGETPAKELDYTFDSKATNMFASEFEDLRFVKPSLYSYLLNYLGVAGYYNPFTAECQYNRYIPTAKIPFTIAHEVAHRQGVAPEDKANFVGFVKAAQSRNGAEAYSGNYRALRSLLTALLPNDSIFVKKRVAQYTSGMEADRLANQRFFEKYDGRSRTAFRGLNNAYLKANQQKGVASYNDFLLYLVAYERKTAQNP